MLRINKKTWIPVCCVKKVVITKNKFIVYTDQGEHEIDDDTMLMDACTTLNLPHNKVLGEMVKDETTY